MNCRRTGTTCDGYLPVEIARATPQVTDPEDTSPGVSLLSTQKPSFNLPGTHEERKCFDCFRQRTVLEFSGNFVGSLYDKFDIKWQVIQQQAQTTVCRQNSIEPYNQALAQLQQNLGDDENGKFLSMLICCPLYRLRDLLGQLRFSCATPRVRAENFA